MENDEKFTNMGCSTMFLVPGPGFRGRFWTGCRRKPDTNGPKTDPKHPHLLIFTQPFGWASCVRLGSAVRMRAGICRASGAALDRPPRPMPNPGSREGFKTVKDKGPVNLGPPEDPGPYTDGDRQSVHRPDE